MSLVPTHWGQAWSKNVRNIYHVLSDPHPSPPPRGCLRRVCVLGVLGHPLGHTSRVSEGRGVWVMCHGEQCVCDKRSPFKRIDPGSYPEVFMFRPVKGPGIHLITVSARFGHMFSFVDKLLIRRCRGPPVQSMLRDSASWPETGLPGRTSAGFWSGKPQNRPSGRPKNLGVYCEIVPYVTK